jgi:hypothetical protein
MQKSFFEHSLADSGLEFCGLRVRLPANSCAVPPTAGGPIYSSRTKPRLRWRCRWFWTPDFPTEFLWRRGELNRQPDSGAATGKVLDYPANLRPFTRFPEHDVRPKTAGKNPNNPRKTGPGPVDRK